MLYSKCNTQILYSGYFSRGKIFSKGRYIVLGSCSFRLWFWLTCICIADSYRHRMQYTHTQLIQQLHNNHFYTEWWYSQSVHTNLTSANKLVPLPSSAWVDAAVIQMVHQTIPVELHHTKKAYIVRTMFQGFQLWITTYCDILDIMIRLFCCFPSQVLRYITICHGLYVRESWLANQLHV